MDTTSGNLQRAQERLIRGAHLKHSSHPRPQYRGGSIELGPVPFAAGEAGKEPLARNCLTLSRDPIWPLVLGDGDRSFILLLIPFLPTPNPSEHPLASPSKQGRVGYSLLSVLIVPISCPYQSPTALPCCTEMVVFFYRQ